LYLLFLPFLKMEKSKNGPSLLTTPRVLLALRANPRFPLKEKLNLRPVVTDDTQGTSCPESKIVGSRKSAVSSEREAESEASESTHSLPSAASPTNKRKKDEVADFDTSKADKSPAEETVREEQGKTFNPYDDALVSL
jgi:hypothetical protein